MLAVRDWKQRKCLNSLILFFILAFVFQKALCSNGHTQVPSKVKSYSNLRYLSSTSVKLANPMYLSCKHLLSIMEPGRGILAFLLGDCNLPEASSEACRQSREQNLDYSRQVPSLVPEGKTI